MVANSTKVSINNLYVNGAKGESAVQFQPGKNAVQTSVNLSNFTINNSKNRGILVKKGVNATIKNGVLKNNGQLNSLYPVVQLNDERIIFENVKVTGHNHIEALRVGANITLKIANWSKEDRISF